MMRFTETIWLTIFCFFFACSAFAQPTPLITKSSVGSIKLGMTVAEIRLVAAPMSLSRSSDGEGVALIAVKKGAEEVMTLYAGEKDPSKKINESAILQHVEVWRPCYKTQEGIHPGILLEEVEKYYGKLKSIQLSEIESREYATFSKQPKGISLRVSGKNGSAAGHYVNGSNISQSYSKEAYVLSVSIP